MADMELHWVLLCTGMILLTGFVIGYIAGYGRGRKDKEGEHDKR